VVIEESDGKTKVTSICKDDPLKYLKSVWTIEEKGRQSSQVTYEIDFEFDSIIYQLASSAFMGVMGKAMWDVFLARATQLACLSPESIVNPSPSSNLKQ
jgi:ribosome-associated toxin RatA of RatAB toxin-antitoxin module